MDRLIVDFSVLGGLVEALAAHIDATDHMLGDVDQTVRDLKTSWAGDAQQQFHQAMNDWSAAVHDLRDELHRIREFVVTAHGNHANAVGTNVRIWRV